MAYKLPLTSSAALGSTSHIFNPSYTQLKTSLLCHFPPALPVFQPTHPCGGSNPSESHPLRSSSLYPASPAALRCFLPGAVLSCPEPDTAAPAWGMHCLPASASWAMVSAPHMSRGTGDAEGHHNTWSSFLDINKMQNAFTNSLCIQSHIRELQKDFE